MKLVRLVILWIFSLSCILTAGTSCSKNRIPFNSTYNGAVIIIEKQAQHYELKWFSRPRDKMTERFEKLINPQVIELSSLPPELDPYSYRPYRVEDRFGQLAPSVLLKIDGTVLTGFVTARKTKDNWFEHFRVDLLPTTIKLGRTTKYDGDARTLTFDASTEYVLISDEGSLAAFDTSFDNLLKDVREYYILHLR